MSQHCRAITRRDRAYDFSALRTLRHGPCSVIFSVRRCSEVSIQYAV
jgi:hypothetical protein